MSSLLFLKVKKSIYSISSRKRGDIIFEHRHTQGVIMSNSNKSGFEIRADLLSLAEGILNQNIDKEFQTIFEWNNNHPENKKDLPLRSISARDVIETAKELYSFVNEK